jgi:D-amino-acid dehydrogenase
MKVAVLGAGVVGVASAYFLARAGHQVTVVDRQPAVAQETSFANGGQISVSHAEPWANPHTPWKALCWFGREEAPLLFRPRLDAALLDWSLRFLRECTPGRTRANVRAIVALALYSRARLKALRQELAGEGGLAYDQLERGILHLYTDRREYAAACEASQLMRELGCNRRPVDVDECIAIEPTLAGVRPRLVGGDYTAEDESGDAQRFTEALAAHCRRLGVSFRLGACIERLRESGGRIDAAIVDGEALVADAYVVALGSYSRLLLRPLGINIPVYPAKGYSATIPLGADSVAPSVSLTDDEFKIVFSRLGDRLRVAGTAEFSGYNLDLNPVRCELLTRRALSLFPDLRPAGEPTYWTGLRPATPSNVPLLGRSRIANLWLNTGHGTLGWTMACGSGAALADLISGRAPVPDFPFLKG